MRTSASVETCSLSMRQCQQTAIARMHCINSGHTNISVEFCLSLWNKFGLLLYYTSQNQQRRAPRPGLISHEQEHWLPAADSRTICYRSVLDNAPCRRLCSSRSHCRLRLENLWSKAYIIFFHRQDFWPIFSPHKKRGVELFCGILRWWKKLILHENMKVLALF